jgi:homoserine dehydrogenase
MKIALIGFGTVGQGVYQILQEKKDLIKEVTKEEIQVKYIVNSGRNLERFAPEIREKINLDYDQVLEEVDLIVEATGAYQAGFDYIKKAMEKKVHVVTANKAVVSGFYEELFDLAKENKVEFLFEASVCGGTPVISPLSKLIVSNKVNSIRAILNGTCNYLLNMMYDKGLDYAECLKECQDLGFAEQDPTDDVEGFDTMRKLRILTTMTMGEIKEKDIALEGISKINKEIINYTKENNKKIKFIASSVLKDGKVTSIIEPVIIDQDTRFASLSEALNIVEASCDNVGQVSFIGPGAGKLPTGNAIVTDILDVCMGKSYPLIKKDPLEVENDSFKASYLLYTSSLDQALIEKKEGSFIITKKVPRKELLEKIDKDTFFARIEE